LKGKRDHLALFHYVLCPVLVWGGNAAGRGPRPFT
jgi:hypothetical protein